MSGELLSTHNLEFTAIIFNALLLVAMGLGMIFAKRIDRFRIKMAHRRDSILFRPLLSPHLHDPRRLTIY